MEIRRDILWRVYLSFLGIGLLGALVIGRAFYIQKVQGNYWKGMSDSLHQRIEEIDAERGTIYSEDGQMLSTSLPIFDIYIDFMADGLREKNGKRFHQHLDSFAISMSNYFGDHSAAEYKRMMLRAYSRKDRYFSLRKKMNFQDYKAFREFPLVRLGRNRSGVIAEVSSRRLLPFGLLANRTLGLSREYIASNGKLRKQNVGLEKSYDSLLTGQKGQRLVRFIYGGVPVPVDGYQVEPENGKDIVTTLDVTIQDITSTALLKMMEESKSLNGTAIVMETRTGKIKAIANLGLRPDGSYFEDNNYALNVTEPGSTIKLATLLAVLEEKNSLNKMVEVGTAGRMKVGPRIVNDAERSPKPVLSIKECFAHSSNVGMSRLALDAFGNDPSRFRKYLEEFQMVNKLPIDLTDLPRPRLASLKKNEGGLMNMVTMSFGYAIQVSPLHTLTLYNAVANNGRMMKPYLVHQVQREGLVVKEYAPSVLKEQISSSSTIRAAQESMEAVVTEGTAKNAFKDLPFGVAGKTGTAHVADGPIRYRDGVYQASFAGYFPANDPQYSCIVVIRTRPHAALHYGGQLAAPVFRDIATRLYALYVERKDAQQFIAKKDSILSNYSGAYDDIRNVVGRLSMPMVDSCRKATYATLRCTPAGNLASGKTITELRMPDLKGMGLKDVLFLVENMGLRLEITGRGKVLRQSIPAGTELQKGLTVYVDLG